MLGVYVLRHLLRGYSDKSSHALFKPGYCLLFCGQCAEYVLRTLSRGCSRKDLVISAVKVRQ